MSDNSRDNKRITKNTMYLYFRTILIMLITLYTSRVILNTLGVVDYGVYNAVAGVVSMFTVLTGALSAAISRYITFELGKSKDNIDRLKLIFSTSIRIQVVLGVIILILGESVGLWFLNAKLNIPPDRMVAANWVWQSALVAFIVSLVTVPFSATVIAHEHMNTYAIVCIIDSVLKLGICYLLIITPWDKLSSYAVLLATISFFNLIIYYFYCRKKIKECRWVKMRDNALAKDMFGFAGFSFLNNAANIFNSQGLNILINMFFGVTLNAARGIATQVEGAVMQLVNNFTVAVNPQITKSYAQEDKGRMFNLVCMGSKFAYFMLLLIAIPVFLETEYILQLWLKIVPEYTVVFVRLAVIGGMVKMLGNTGYTACMATGKIKKYSILITSVGILAFPLTWIAFELGGSAEYAYLIFIAVYIAVEIVRLILMKQMLGFPPSLFIKEVLLKIIIVTPVASIIPILVSMQLDAGWIRLVVTLILSTLSTCIVVYFIGLTQHERVYFTNLIISKLPRRNKKR